MAEEGGSCAYQLPHLRQLSLSGSGSANENTHPPGFTAAPNPFIFIFRGILTFIKLLLKCGNLNQKHLEIIIIDFDTKKNTS